MAIFLNPDGRNLEAVFCVDQGHLRSAPKLMWAPFELSSWRGHAGAQSVQKRTGSLPRKAS